MIENKTRHLLLLNLSTVLLATSGVLGKLVSLPADQAVFMRCLLGLLALAILMRIAGTPLKINWRKDWRFFSLAGVFLAMHWVSYFYALNVSSVAVSFIALFTFPVITTLLEPLFFRTRLSKLSLMNGLLVVLGIYWLVPSFELSSNLTVGVLAALFSAVCFSLRNLLNKQYIHVYPTSVTMTWQLLVAAIVLLPTMLISPVNISAPDWGYLLLLGIFTTAIGQTLFIGSFRYFSAGTASIISSAQPVVGILMAVVILGEQLNWRIFLGGGLILGTVLFEHLRQYLEKPPLATADRRA